MVIPVAKSYSSDELRQIREELGCIKSIIPQKTRHEIELEELQNAVNSYKSVTQELENKVSRLLSMNERLMMYIDNIEEVKASGGIEISFAERYDFKSAGVLRTKLVTIPEVKIAVLCDEKDG